MTTYLYDSVDANDIVRCESLEADSWREAQEIADVTGWILLGEFVADEDCPDLNEAMIQQQHNEIH